MCCVFSINCGLVNTLNYLIRKNVGPYKPYKPYNPYRSCKPYPLAEAYQCRNPEQSVDNKSASILQIKRKLHCNFKICSYSCVVIDLTEGGGTTNI